MEAVAKKPPPHGRSNFAVTTARREILGDPLHRRKAPPTLQGFCQGHGPDDVDEYPDHLPLRHFGQFASTSPDAAVVADTSFSFLTEVLCDDEHIYLVDSCNGLFLFGCFMEESWDLAYIVCNPATRQWATVPICDDDVGSLEHNLDLGSRHAYLLFDPAISSHFHVVLFWGDNEPPLIRTTAHSYSSETGVWSHSQTHWSEEEERQGPWEGWRQGNDYDSSFIFGGSFFDGFLYIMLRVNRVLKVDAQGKTRRIIQAPTGDVEFVGPSQGLLHCVVQEPSQLSVWVLQGEQTWVLKHRTTKGLFGNNYDEPSVYSDVVTMHPDCNIIFIIQHWDLQLISYDMDRQKVSALQSFHDDWADPRDSGIILIPFTPYLSKLFLGVIGAHK